MTFIIQQISPEATHSLRQLILRPQQGLSDCAFSGDKAPGSVHFAAFHGNEMVGVVSLYREAHPDWPDPHAWRIRGMATLERVRGQGIGRALLERVVAHAERQAPPALIWCNARALACGFYQKAGFKIASGRFEIAGAGPHYLMLKRCSETD